ncbi:sigma-54-dependent transcriptional regulator [Luteitalea sp.]|jgi:DNA-binding NtrC family response regulator|uniref:sigma-54-dependent transcriptional regulator n=1 Tax=Luteitalea sp. TaxID=2004800 RepID=UPI0037C76CD3
MSAPLRPLLLVDDEGAFRRGVAEYLSGAGFEVTEASTVAEALEQLEGFAFDVVLTDLRLPDGEGTTVLEAARARYPEIVVLVVTGHGSIRAAVEAIRQGAADFVTKPFQLAELDLALGRALERQRLREENTYLREQLRERYRLDQLVGRSAAMQEVFKVVETVAPTTSTILILGETGTGKELVARAIHQLSPRAGEKFVALNCSAIPESLLEAELFGHTKGAFTGAVAARPGRFEVANRGTLFLDEIATMPVLLQAKLLRALQQREVERIGEARPIRIDVRVLAATNADLEGMVKAGTFREDLFYRLNVIPVQLPPLRDRRDDVPLLVRDMLQRLGALAVPPRTDVTFSQEAMRRLMAYEWPGNIRQLENTVERALALSPGRSQIDVSVLPPDVRGDKPGERGVTIALPEQGLDLERELAVVERVYIAQALARTEQNRSRAADLLGVKRTTLVEKIKRLERLGLGDGLL